MSGLVVRDPAREFAEPTREDREGLEMRAGVESLESLHAARDAIVEEMAKLEALHGAFGLYDDVRKQLLEVCKLEAREKLTASGGKVTESFIDSTAYGSVRYKTYLDQGVIDRATHIRNAHRLTKIDNRIKARDTAMFAYNSELKLAR